MPCTKAKRLVIFWAALALASFPAVRASGLIPPPEVEWVPGEIVVKLRGNVGALGAHGQLGGLPEDVARLNRQLGVTSIEPIFPRSETSSRIKTSAAATESGGLDRWVRLRFAGEIDEQAFASRYRTLSSVETAEPNFIFRLVASEDGQRAANSAASPSLKIQPHLIPNDPSFPSQWGLAHINAPQAWDITQGSAAQVIAIIDTGIDLDHPDLASKIWTNPIEVVGDNNGDGCPGVCGADDDGDGLVDEDGAGRQPGNVGYDPGYKFDDDENGYIDDLRGAFAGFSNCGYPIKNPGVGPEMSLLALRRSRAPMGSAPAVEPAW